MLLNFYYCICKTKLTKSLFLSTIAKPITVNNYHYKNTVQSRNNFSILLCDFKINTKYSITTKHTTITD